MNAMRVSLGWAAATAALLSAGCVTGGARFVGVQQGPEAGARFGAAGYYWLAPDAEISGRSTVDTDLTAHGTLARKPEVLAAHPVPAAGASWVNYLFYVRVARPAGAEAGDGEPVRIGGLSVRMDQRGEVDGLETIHAKALSFTLAGDAPFRLGVMVDAFDQIGAYAPDYVVIREEATGRTWHNMPSVVRDGKPDLMLFDLRGSAGAVYSVELHRAASAEAGLRIAGLSGLTFDAAGPGAPAPVSACAAIGEFSRAGEYMKDYYVFKEGDTYHLFYNVGDAGVKQCWTQPRNEKAFGHATSKDLKTWTHHPRVLEVVPGTWEGMVVSAPSILKHDGLYYMIYTGFDDRWRGMQTIGLATSKDLFTWERHPANPVYRAPAWARTSPNAWEDCRDAHIIRYGDEFLMYTMVQMKDGKGAIALASSKDLVTWEDHGPALITFREPESPRVFEHNGTYYMFATSGHGRVLYKTRNPKSDDWTAVDFNWPANIPGAAMGQQWAAIWSGWEVVEFEGRLVFSAFLWKPHGGYIKFWDVKWDGDVPTVIYEK
jgi:predicted GH43/DUF377 family glycosyl hydrolase